MSEVHYDTIEIKDYKNSEYGIVEYKAACGVIIGRKKLRRGYEHVNNYSTIKDEVTCKNCKRTKVFKNG